MTPEKTVAIMATIAACPPGENNYDTDYIGNVNMPLAIAELEIIKYRNAARDNSKYQSDEPWGGWGFELLVEVDGTLTNNYEPSPPTTTVARC